MPDRMPPRPQKKPTAAPFWGNFTPAAAHDVRRLLPATLRRGDRFETEDDTENEAAARFERLNAGNTADIRLGKKLCPADTDGSDPCLSPACPHCARRHRIWRVAVELQLLRQFEEVHPIHLLFPQHTAPYGRLDEVDLKAIDSMLYQQLVRTYRARQIPVVMVGSFEIGVDHPKKRYLPHFHGFMANCTAADVELLRSRYRPMIFTSDDPAAPQEWWDRLMKTQPMKDWVRQVNYAGKFNTSYRPFAQTGSKSSRMVRLPRAQHNEMMRFLAAHEFVDFLFLYNVRRLGTQLTRNPLVEPDSTLSMRKRPKKG